MSKHKKSGANMIYYHNYSSIQTKTMKIKELYSKKEFCNKVNCFGSYKWECIKDITPEEFYVFSHSGTLKHCILQNKPTFSLNNFTIGKITQASIGLVLHDDGYCTKDIHCSHCVDEKITKSTKYARFKVEDLIVPYDMAHNLPTHIDVNDSDCKMVTALKIECVDVWHEEDNNE